tara:strand:- start:357 stop:485 length:129 start_codon:yes stop_codon:yes gene_type:complete
MRNKTKLNRNILVRKWEETSHVIVGQKRNSNIAVEDFKELNK